MIKAILFDISGVLYQDNSIIPGAIEVIDHLTEAGIAIRFVTNSSRSTKHEIHSTLQQLGFHIDPEHIFTAVSAIQQVVKDRQLKPYCLIHPNIRSEFEYIEAEDADAVVITDAAEQFDFKHLNQAFELLVKGAPLLGIGRNRYFRHNNNLCLDAGPFIHALEYAANVKAEILGKPEAAFFMAAVDSIGCLVHEVVMIGDDVDADVIGALDAGIDACLVKTGKYRKGDEFKSGRQFDCLASIANVFEHYFS